MGSDDKKVVVKTEVLQPGIQPIGVNYRMLLSDGEWKAYDIMIEGVSLVTNYRTTFSQEVQTKGSLNAVIEGLVKRNAEALAAKPTANGSFLSIEKHAIPVRHIYWPATNEFALQLSPLHSARFPRPINSA